MPPLGVPGLLQVVSQGLPKMHLRDIHVDALDAPKHLIHLRTDLVHALLQPVDLRPELANLLEGLRH